MKKTFMLIAAMLFSVAMWAQNPSFKIADQPNKSFNFINSDHTEVIAEENGRLLVTLKDSYSSIFAAGASDIMVRWVDKNLNVAVETKLEDTKGFKLLASSVTEDHVVLMISDMSRKSCIVQRVVLNKQTLKKISTETLFSEEFSRKDDAYIRAAKSPNGDFFALQVAVETKENMDCELLVLDDEMQQVWKRRSPIALYGCLWVSDEADVYMVLGGSTEDQIRFAKYSEDDEYNYAAKTNEFVYSAKILNVIDECVIIGGVYVEHTGRKGNKEFIKGLYGMSFNIATGSLVGQDYHPATDQEKLVMMNKKITANSKDYLPGSITEVASTPTDFGGAMLLSDSYSITVTNSNGGSSTTYFRVGMLAFAVNKSGEVVWSVPVRHFEKASTGLYFSSLMFAKGDKVFFSNTESAKSLPSYDIQKPEKACNPVLKSTNVAVYSVDENGKVGKTIVASKQKASLCGATSNWIDGHYYLLQAGKKDSKLVTVSCE